VHTSSPFSPTTAIGPREYLERTVAVCRERDIVLAYDNPYCELTFDGYRAPSILEFPGARDVAVEFHSLSKSFSMTGWRVGWVCAPAELLEAMMKIHQYTIMSAPTPSQYAALEAIRNGEEDAQRMIAEFDSRRRLIVAALNEMGLTCFDPHGAFYAFPSVRSTGLDDIEFAERLLLEEKVAVIPGSSFGECGRGHVRACYAAPKPILEDALERVRRFVSGL